MASLLFQLLVYQGRLLRPGSSKEEEKATPHLARESTTNSRNTFSSLLSRKSILGPLKLPLILTLNT